MSFNIHCSVFSFLVFVSTRFGLRSFFFGSKVLFSVYGRRMMMMMTGFLRIYLRHSRN